MKRTHTKEVKIYLKDTVIDILTKGKTQELPLFQGLMTPTTMTATIIKSIIMAMHIHFRELFWCFLALCRAVVPDWTLVTAFETWTDISINTHNQTKYVLQQTCAHTETQPNQKGWEYKSKPGFQCCPKFLLGPQLELPYPCKSGK